MTKRSGSLLLLSSLFFLACGPMDPNELAEEDMLGEQSEELKNTGGGPTGAGFTCGGPDFPGQCSCDGPADSLDCQKMKKNCKDEIKCGWAVDNCVCTWARTVPGTGKWPHAGTAVLQGGAVLANP